MLSINPKDVQFSANVGPQPIDQPVPPTIDGLGRDRIDASPLSGTSPLSLKDLERTIKAPAAVFANELMGEQDIEMVVGPQPLGTFASPPSVSSLNSDSNNSLSTAEDLDQLTGTEYRYGVVGGGDTADYYRFELTSGKDVDITLTGLDANANINLIHDKNNNNQVDQGEQISYSRQYAKLSEAISAHGLAADDNYYVEVYSQDDQSSNYTLGLTPITPRSTVDVTINAVNAIDKPDTFLGRADYYAKVTIDGGTEQQTSTIDDDNYITPNWTFEQDTTGIVPITFKLYDEDWGSDDHIDINPATGAKDLTVFYHTHTGNVYGPGVFGQEGNVITVRGSGDSDRAEIQFTVDQTIPQFSRFDVSDASNDLTPFTVFKGGAIETDFTFTGATSSPTRVTVEAWKDGQSTTLGRWNNTSSINNQLTSLTNKLQAPGDYDIRAVATLSNGAQYFSNFDQITVLEREMIEGNQRGETFNYNAAAETGTIVLGRGGTDTLNLVGLSSNDVSSLNTWFDDPNWNPPFFNASFNGRQAVFGGTSFDALQLDDGREIYFQGIEKLKFTDGVLDLAVTPNDPYFNQQWNLHAQDVPSAWRFTQGSANNVLLVSLDTGVLKTVGVAGDVVDIDTNRLLTDQWDDDDVNTNEEGYSHGHNAIGIMAATADEYGTAGINQNSEIYVADVYEPEMLLNRLDVSILDAIILARDTGRKVVFQGGIQGESWLEDYGTQVSDLMEDNRDIAFMAVSAGNGGPSGNLDDPNYETSVSGIAKLASSHDNILSIGALRSGSAIANIPVNVDGFANAGDVALAEYSNRGPNLSLVAATDSPVMNKLDTLVNFGGTSAANPNAAGIASLVWSVNSSLTGEEVGQILEDTATDLGDVGRDNTYGHGFINADAAVRRAKALKQNAAVANLYNGSSIFT